MTKPETVIIPLSDLKSSPMQPRKHFDEEHLRELAESMRQHGFSLSTILVRPIPNGSTPSFEILDGERRVRAATAAGVDGAPCYVRECSDSEALAIMLIANLQREDLTAIEEAEGYRQALEFKNDQGVAFFTLETLSLKIAKSERWIRERLTLCNLPEEPRREVEAGRLPPKVAMLIARIPDEKMRLEAGDLILHPRGETGPLSLRRAEIVIHDKFIRDLRQAKFTLADAVLVPVQKDEKGERVAGGACEDCPFRTGVNREEKAGRGKQGAYICMNPTCFEEKQARVWERWQEKETDLPNKRRATTEPESFKLYPTGNELAAHFGLVDLDEFPDGSDLKPGVHPPGKWKQLVKGRGLAVTVTKDRLAVAGVHELVERDKAIEAARMNGHQALFKSPEREKPRDHETRKHEEKEKEQKRESSKAAIIASIDLVRKNVSTKTITSMLRLQIDREIEFSKAHPEFLKRWSLPIGGSVAKQLAKRPLKDLVAILVEFVVAEGGFSYDSLHPSNLDWLKVFGVDYSKVEKQVAKSEKTKRK